MYNWISIRSGLSLALLILQLISCGPSEEDRKRSELARQDSIRIKQERIEVARLDSLRIEQERIEVEARAQWVVEANKPLEILGKLEARIEIGISCNEYRIAVGDALYYIKEFQTSAYSDYEPNLSKLLTHIRDMHKDVTIMWDCDHPDWYIDGGLSARSIEVHYKDTWNALHRNGLTVPKEEGGVWFIHNYRYMGPSEEFDVILATQILWRRISDELDNARKIVRSK